MIELQRSVLVYSYAGYSGVLRKVEHLQETIDQKLIDVMPAAEKNEEIKQRLDRLKSHYTAYKNGFETAVKKRKALKNIQSTKFSALNEEINQHLNFENLDDEEIENDLEDFQGFNLFSGVFLMRGTYLESLDQ